MTGAEMEFIENMATGLAVFVGLMVTLYLIWRYAMEKM